MTVQALIDSMTLEEKIGQLFLLAFSKDRLDEARILFEEYFVGASYISNDNVPTPEAAGILTTQLQQYADSTRLKIPLLLGADQEGAWGVMVPGSCTGPGNMALGATGHPEDAYAMYEVIGRELLSVGLNAVFGPAADCNSNPYNSIIGMRSFGEKPGLVGAMTAAAVRGAHAGGIIATVKHFPGHGDTTLDTHRGLATVERSRDELGLIDLYPFAEGIRAGADIVMTSHILFPAIDPENPATLSKSILIDILRDEMGFEGVILTDSMNMQAMMKHFAPVDSAIRAVNAGVDLIMLAEEHYNHDAATYLRSQTKLINGVKLAVEEGRISLARLNDAITHVLELKQKFGIWPGEPERTLSPENVGSPQGRAVELEVSRRAVAVLRDKQQHIPLDRTQAITLVNTTTRTSYDILGKTRGIGPNQTTPAFDYFAVAFQQQLPDVTVMSAEDILVDGAFPAAGLIIAVTENYALPGVDFDRKSHVPLIRRLHERAADRLIVVALCDPYELTEFPPVQTYVCAFSFRPSSAQAAVDVLLGDVQAVGQTPVSIPATEFRAFDIEPNT